MIVDGAGAWGQRLSGRSAPGGRGFDVPYTFVPDQTKAFHHGGTETQRGEIGKALKPEVP